MDTEQRYTSSPTTAAKGSCTKCLRNFIRIVRYFPFALITTLYLWGLYVYLYYVIYTNYDEQLWLQALLMILFIPLYLLSFVSYVKCVFAQHRPISSEYHLPESLRLNQMTNEERNSNLEALIQDRNLPIFTRAYNGYVRFCSKCLVLKPDRAHHCSTCGKCICKMDHHCHWVSNCVAFDNYKYFILFLFYTAIICLFVVFSSLDLFIKFWRDQNYPGKFQVFFLVLFCFIFSMSIMILLFYHIYLVSKNVTTLESYQIPRFKNCEYDNHRFDLGCRHNLKSVFGDRKLYWILPIYNSLGDGHNFQLPLLTSAGSGTIYQQNETQNFPQNHYYQQQSHFLSQCQVIDNI